MQCNASATGSAAVWQLESCLSQKPHHLRFSHFNSILLLCEIWHTAKLGAPRNYHKTVGQIYCVWRNY